MSAVEVRPVEKKGNCLFVSAGEFKPGDRVFSETALVLCDPNSQIFKIIEDALRQKISDFEPRNYAGAVMSVLCKDKATQQKIESKYIAHPERRPKFCELVIAMLRKSGTLTKEEVEMLTVGSLVKHVGIWSTNAFSHGEGLALFDKISFISHSCTPTVNWLHDGIGTMTLIALRELEAGDEVTLSYISQQERAFPTFMRRDLLAQLWDFHCECERCAEILDPFRVA